MALELLGKGIYTIPEASRLSKVGPGKIKRWISGYEVAGRPYNRVFAPDIPPIDHAYALSFHDLIEVRFINEFRKHGVSWPTIRIAFNKAMEILQSNHPFASRRFHTDGKHILAEVSDKKLLELVRDQLEWTDLIERYLVRGIEFTENDMAGRWWPLPESKRIVIDPTRRFGKPIVDKFAIPTSAIASAFNTEQSVEDVARWFQIDEESVRDAIEFEEQLAA